MENTKETILIVDDSRFQRAVIRETFKEKFRIMEAASGEECLQIIGENPDDIDLVLLDLVMPGIDGFEVLRRRRQMQSFSDIPVIFLTSKNDRESITQVMSLKPEGYLLKTMKPEDIVKTVDDFFEKRKKI